MLDNISTITFLIVNAFSVYTVKIFFDNFLIHYRFSKKIVFLIYSAVYIIDSAIYLNSNRTNFLIITITAFLLTIGMSVCYQATLRNTLLFSVFNFVLNYVSEIIVYNIVNLYYKINLIILIGQANYFILFSVLGRLTFYVLVKIVCRLFGKAEDIKIPFSYWLAIYIVPIGSLFVMHAMYAQDYKNNDSMNELSVAATIVLLLINFLIFFLYERIIRLYNIKTQNAMLSIQNTYYAKQYQIMEESDAETRQLRHDLRGHLAAIKAYADHGDIAEINGYIENLLGKTVYKGNYSICGILAIDGIINLKMHEAVKLGAKIDVTINVPGDLQIDPVDMTIILSNLLDNAVEACEHVEQDKRFIHFHMEYDKKNMFINVVNSCDDSMTKKSGNGTRTTKPNKAGEIHGQGLDNVRSVVKKYDGTVSVDTEPQKFTCSVLMYSIERTK